jgi:hypothetical protein
MEMRNVTLADFEASVARVNQNYDGNLAVHPDAHQMGSRVPKVVGRMWVHNSREAGARTSWSGRRVRAACWHAFRDVFRDLIAHNPNVVIITSLARYTEENFENTYPATGNRNVGSMVRPAYMPDLCDCLD